MISDDTKSPLLQRVLQMTTTATILVLTLYGVYMVINKVLDQQSRHLETVMEQCLTLRGDVHK